MPILYLKCIVRSTGPRIHFPFLNSKINSNYKHNDITSLSFWQFNYLTCKATHFTSRISLTVVFGRNLRMVVVLPGFLSLWYRLPEEKMKYSSILNSNIFQSKKSFTIMKSLLADSFSNWFQFLKIIKKIVFHTVFISILVTKDTTAQNQRPCANPTTACFTTQLREELKNRQIIRWR